MALLFDHCWDTDRDAYGRADSDKNSYITGHMCGHVVVLAVLPAMGTTNAAAVTASLRASYPRLTLALIVGICGGVPQIGGYDAFLGDVVVSRTIVRYDDGRQYPGPFIVKESIEDSLGRPSSDVRGLLAVFQTEHARERLQGKATEYLKELQTKAAQRRRRTGYQHLEFTEDRLFFARLYSQTPSFLR